MPAGTSIFFRDYPDITFQGVFDAPLSTAPTDAFEVELSDPDGTTLNTWTLKLDDLVPAAI